jgi:hypothetical protein
VIHPLQRVGAFGLPAAARPPGRAAPDRPRMIFAA